MIMRQMTLTPHQHAALDWIVTRITSGSDVVALRGLAGTGKSTCIPHLEAALLAQDLPVTIGAPTHRAAMILRRKGLRNADTIHAHALTPYFTPEYACALDWLTPDLADGLQACPTRQPYDAAAYCEPDGARLPLLLAEKLRTRYQDADALRRIARSGQHGPRKALESLGIHGSKYFDGFGPKAGEGVLIIDEASMVGNTTLAMCLEAFPQVVLIGDPGQLPPVKEAAMLATIDGVDLTEIHRQAGDSPIVQLAYAARTQAVDWSLLPYHPDQLDEWFSVTAARFLVAPLIVWRNATRTKCTQAIRYALGYPDQAVVDGEPLVCRSTSQEDRALGFFNNALYRVIRVLSTDPLRATVAPDGKEDDDDSHETIRLHLEELHGDSIHPDAIPFRFGYCLTAHTAQGGEWPTVYIAKPDMLAYMGMCRRKGDDAQAEAARWAYTAITRAKEHLGFVANYDFTQEKRIMPKMTAHALEEQPLLADDPHPLLTDDIPDPAVPLRMHPAAAEPTPPQSVDPSTPAGQAVMTLDEALYKFSMQSATVLAAVEKSWEQKLRTLNLQQDAIALLAEGIKAYTPVVPYSATVHVTTPSGFIMQMQVQHATQEGFLAEVGNLMQFLKQNEFQPHIPVPF